MAKLKKKVTQPVKTPKRNLKDPLVGLRFTFTRGDPPDYGVVEARVSPGMYLVRLAPDYQGLVLSASQMSKFDVVFHAKAK
jgi:hypothetical protein